jgi:hypothetical protein
VLQGNVAFGGGELTPGDGVAVTDERVVAVRGTAPAEILLFDLA